MLCLLLSHRHCSVSLPAEISTGGLVTSLHSFTTSQTPILKVTGRLKKKKVAVFKCRLQSQPCGPFNQLWLLRQEKMCCILGGVCFYESKALFYIYEKEADKGAI